MTVSGGMLFALLVSCTLFTAADPSRKVSEGQDTSVVVICEDGSLTIDRETIDCAWLSDRILLWLIPRESVKSITVVASPAASAGDVLTVYSYLLRSAAELKAKFLRSVEVSIMPIRDLEKLQRLTSITPWLADERYCPLSAPRREPPRVPGCAKPDEMASVDLGVAYELGKEELGDCIPVRFIGSGRVTDELGQTRIVGGGSPAYAVGSELDREERVFVEEEDAVQEVLSLFATRRGKCVAIECGEENRWGWVDEIVQGLSREGCREIALVSSGEGRRRGVMLEFPRSLPTPPTIPAGFLGGKKRSTRGPVRRRKCPDR